MNDARKILDERLVKGEITTEEHTKLLAHIASPSEQPPVSPPDALPKAEPQSAADTAPAHPAPDDVEPTPLVKSLVVAVVGTLTLMVSYFLFDYDGSDTGRVITVTSFIIFAVIFFVALIFHSARAK